MFEIFEQVRIKEINVEGEIIDVVRQADRKVYIVESNDEGDVTDPEVLRKYTVWNLKFPLYYCTEDQLE